MVVGLIVSIVFPVAICISIISCLFCGPGVIESSTSRRPTNTIVPVAAAISAHIASHTSVDKQCCLATTTPEGEPPPPYENTGANRRSFQQGYAWRRVNGSFSSTTSKAYLQQPAEAISPQPTGEQLTLPTGFDALLPSTRSDSLQPHSVSDYIQLPTRFQVPTESPVQAPSELDIQTPTPYNIHPPTVTSPQSPTGVLFFRVSPYSRTDGSATDQSRLTSSRGVPTPILSSGSPLHIAYPSPATSPRLSPLPHVTSPPQQTGLFQAKFTRASPPLENINPH